MQSMKARSAVVLDGRAVRLSSTSEGQVTELERAPTSKQSQTKRTRIGTRIILLAMILILLVVSAAFGLLTYWPWG